MEIWHTYNNMNIQIELIDHFIGGNQEIKIFFVDNVKKKWMLYFDFVLDFRYAIENAFLNRDFCRREQASVYIVENSEYISYFENQIAGTRPVDELKHFLIFDIVDTGLEILTSKPPILQEVNFC